PIRRYTTMSTSHREQVPEAAPTLIPTAIPPSRPPSRPTNWPRLTSRRPSCPAGRQNCSRPAGSAQLLRLPSVCVMCRASELASHRHRVPFAVRRFIGDARQFNGFTRLDFGTAALDRRQDLIALV